MATADPTRAHLASANISTVAMSTVAMVTAGLLIEEEDQVFFTPEGPDYDSVFDDVPEVVVSQGLLSGVDAPPQVQSKSIEVAMHVLISIFGVVGNLMVILTVSCVKQMRTKINLYIFNLALTDFIMILFAIPFAFVPVHIGGFVYGDAACRISRYAEGVLVTANAWTLCIIAVDRFWAVISPMSFRTRNSWIAFRNMLIVWLGSVFVNSPVFAIYHVRRFTAGFQAARYMCTEVWLYHRVPRAVSMSYYILFYLLLSMYVPFLITAVCYGTIVCSIKKSIKKYKNEEKNYESSNYTNAQKKPHLHNSKAAKCVERKGETAGCASDLQQGQTAKSSVTGIPKVWRFLTNYFQRNENVQNKDSVQVLKDEGKSCCVPSVLRKSRCLSSELRKSSEQLKSGRSDPILHDSNVSSYGFLTVPQDAVQRSRGSCGDLSNASNVKVQEWIQSSFHDVHICQELEGAIIPKQHQPVLPQTDFGSQPVVPQKEIITFCRPNSHSEDYVTGNLSSENLVAIGPSRKSVQMQQQNQSQSSYNASASKPTDKPKPHADKPKPHTDKPKPPTDKPKPPKDKPKPHTDKPKPPTAQNATNKAAEFTSHIIYPKSMVKKQMKFIRLMIIIVLFYFLCWGPRHTIFFWKSYDYHQALTSLGRYSKVVVVVTRMMSYVSCCINPILFCFMYQNFRKGFKSLFIRRKRKTASQKAHNKLTFKHSNSTTTTTLSKI